MKRTATLSRSASGLNLYLPEELRQHMGTRRYLVEMVTLGDRTRCLRYYQDDRGRNRPVEYASELLPLRLSLQKNLPAELEALGLFGSTNVEWSRGDEPGELYIAVPPADAMMAPRIQSPRGTGPRSRLKNVTAEVRTVVVRTPHQRLGEILGELNALIAEGRLPDVQFAATTHTGESIQLGGAPRITAERRETFG